MEEICTILVVDRKVDDTQIIDCDTWVSDVRVSDVKNLSSASLD